jgi:hypothetical protein
MRDDQLVVGGQKRRVLSGIRLETFFLKNRLGEWCAVEGYRVVYPEISDSFEFFVCKLSSGFLGYRGLTEDFWIVCETQTGRHLTVPLTDRVDAVRAGLFNFEKNKDNVAKYVADVVANKGLAPNYDTSPITAEKYVEIEDDFWQKHTLLEFIDKFLEDEGGDVFDVSEQLDAE